jgi:hypothetical protein
MSATQEILQVLHRVTRLLAASRLPRAADAWLDEELDGIADLESTIIEDVWPRTTVLRIVSQLRDAGALSPERAQRYHARSRVEERTFRRLMGRRVIRQATPGRYYLDERMYGVLWRRRSFGGRD